MENVKTKHTNQASCPAEENSLKQFRNYKIEGKTFIVEPVFKQDAKETLETILLRLIQSDSETSSP